jgi:hypothetical protein
VHKSFLQKKENTNNDMEVRILVELGKQNPKQIITILKKSIMKGKQSLQTAAFRELLELIKVSAIKPPFDF